MSRIMWILLMCALVVRGQDLSRLPDWAAGAARAAAQERAPEDAEAWVLLDRTEVAYTGSGEIRQRRFRLVKVLREAGLGEAVFALHGLGGGTGKVKKVKGWNLRPDGELVKLDTDHVVTESGVSPEAAFDVSTRTSAVLGRAMVGSLLAFESLESIQHPLGPMARITLMEWIPVRTWELDVAKKEGWFTDLKAVDIRMERRNFAPWCAQVEPLGTHGIRVRQVPVLPRGEGAAPHLIQVLPFVDVLFKDPAQSTAQMWSSWDEIARWEQRHYAEARGAAAPLGLAGARGREGLAALRDWMRRNMDYKQVYLTPERGWIPEHPADVARKRYGDCKDLTALFIAEARSMGFTGFPVLASIGGYELSEQELPANHFNHVFAAIRLEASLGLEAEIETPKGRFLLVDPTNEFTPMGRLSSLHRGRKVLICLPEGAAWSAVPDRAIQREHIGIRLEGSFEGERLKGTLTLTEVGNCWGLRSLIRRGTAERLREVLMSQLLLLPVTGSLDITCKGDPHAVDQPLILEMRIDQPEALKRRGSEWTFAAAGVPGIPRLILKASAPRQYPVASYRTDTLSYQASLRLPGTMQPVCGTLREGSAFRTLAWTASARPEGDATRLELALEHRYQSAHFGFDQRDKGVEAWKKDRSLMRALWTDGLAFKVGESLR